MAILMKKYVVSASAAKLIYTIGFITERYLSYNLNGGIPVLKNKGPPPYILAHLSLLRDISHFHTWSEIVLPNSDPIVEGGIRRAIEVRAANHVLRLAVSSK